MKNFLEIFHHVATRCVVIGDSAGRCNVQKQFNDLIQVNISFDLLGIQQTNKELVWLDVVFFVLLMLIFLLVLWLDCPHLTTVDASAGR